MRGWGEEGRVECEDGELGKGRRRGRGSVNVCEVEGFVTDNLIADHPSHPYTGCLQDSYSVYTHIVTNATVHIFQK